ncbi:hypothetical protein [Streptomyces sp. NPDC058108]|uniref:hypothetical protein n=1 Tax=Streptomyces sp. NPDC058108 TaxID=3346344 RepID=UPI0036EEBD7F
MSSMTKRLSIALASTTLAGGALLGAGGSASAAPASAPVQHTSYVSVQTAGHQAAAAAPQGVTAARWYQDQLSEATSASQGVTAARWYQDQVEEAVLPHGVSTARWHQDQVDEATASYRVTPARWYQDQITWALTHH